MHPNAQLRHELLAHLYAAREAAPKRGWITEYDLKRGFGDVAFALAVLTETGHLAANGPIYRITGAGILAYEAASGA